MSLGVQSGQVSNNTNKWELAQRLSGQSKAPEQALQSIFSGVMFQFEEIANTKFENSMKQRVWNTVSKEKLATLTEKLLHKFCEMILGNFNDSEAGEMLEDHKKTGAVTDIFYNSRLQVAIALKRDSIVDDVMQNANAMSKECMHQIAGELKKEGIVLPNPK